MALKVENLKVYYNTLHGHVKALDDVSFEVKDGEILGIAGESGCGKSTLSNALILMQKPMEYMGGNVYLDSDPLHIYDDKEMTDHRFKNISIIPQYALNALNPTIKLRQFIKELVESRGINFDLIKEELNERLEFVRLDPAVLDQYPLELSGGMKQRVVMVISTLLNPTLLLCDEITSALDVTTQKLVSELVVKFRDKKIVKSVTFVTHDVPVLYQIADRIMIMYAGQIAEIGPSEDIIHNPKHPYTKALVDAMPEVGFQYTDEPFTSIPGRPPALLNPPEGCRFKDRCPKKMDKCSTKPPETVFDKGHRVYCWLEVKQC